MRLLVNVEMDTDKANDLIVNGQMPKVMDGIMARLKPEAAYFYARNGRRAFTLVIDTPDNAALPSVAEPFWIELGATVEALPCMNADELGEGISRLG